MTIKETQANGLYRGSGTYFLRFDSLLRVLDVRLVPGVVNRPPGGVVRFSRSGVVTRTCLAVGEPIVGVTPLPLLCSDGVVGRWDGSDV